LTGASSSGGYTNNYVSLKTLIERLEYGRDVLKQFWRHEIELVRKAMGFRYPAEIHFDSIVLSDEAAEKNLLIQLADRDIISHETLLERFKEMPSMEKVRVRREEKDRRDDVLPDKASPYHNPQHREDIAKIALTKDMLADEYLDDMGLPVSVDETPEPQPTKEAPEAPEKQEDNNEPINPVGRPFFSKDSTKRKQKRVLPKSGSPTASVLWAVQAQDQIADILSPIALSHFNKKNMRSLSKAEMSQVDYLKLCILTGMKPYMDINSDMVKELLDSGSQPSQAFTNMIQNEVESFKTSNNRTPNSSELKYINASVFVYMADLNQ
jgi:hypothetical protein